MKYISTQFFLTILLGCLASMSPIRVKSEIITDTISVSRFQSSLPIKEISEKTYRASLKDGQIIKGIFLKEDNSFQCGNDYPTNHLYKFSADGLLLEKHPFDTPTHTTNVSKYTYSRSGELQSIITTYNFSDIGVKKAITQYTYDEKKHIIECIRYNIFGSLIGKEIYKYNEQGDLTNASIVDSNGDFEKKVVNTYTYYTNGAVKNISSTEEDFLMDEVHTIKKEFDEDGRLLRDIRTMPWGTIDEVFSYNEAGNIEELNYLECPYKDAKETYEYDSSNRLVKRNISYKDNTGEISYYFYDKISDCEMPKTLPNYGLKIFLNGLIQRMEKSGNQYTYEYQFDNHGNWIKAIEFKNGVPLIMKERIISYYG